MPFLIFLMPISESPAGDGAVPTVRILLPLRNDQHAIRQLPCLLR